MQTRSYPRYVVRLSPDHNGGVANWAKRLPLFRLIDCFLLAIPANKAKVEIPFGLMILKPHLAAGIALVAMFERRWSAIGSAAAIAIASSALYTVAMGPGIRRKFMEALRESSHFLAEGF